MKCTVPTSAGGEAEEAAASPARPSGLLAAPKKVYEESRGECPPPSADLAEVPQATASPSVAEERSLSGSH